MISISGTRTSLSRPGLREDGNYMSNLENKSISFDTGIKKIAVNDMDGELITVLRIKTSDANVAKKFVEISRNLDEIANSGAEKAKVFEEKYKEYENQKYENIPEDARNEIIIDASIVRIEVLEKMIEEIDSLFGKDTIRNVFRECYELDEDFVPDEDALIDFVNTVMPVMNDLFDMRTKEIRKKYSPNRKRHNKTKDELIEEYKEKNE